MKRIGKEKTSNRESFTLVGLLGAVMILSVFAGGVGSNDAKGSEKVAVSAATAQAVSDSARERGWASAEVDVLDLQLD